MKESKELGIGVLALAALLVERLKDGAGVDDVMAVIAKLQNDEEFKNKMEEAYKGIDLVDDELKAASAEDYVDLVLALGPEVLKLIKSFRKA